MARTRHERQAFLEQIKTDFDERLARIAADPAQWVSFVEQVAAFGARYSLGNQMLLWMQAEQRGIEPTFFLPFGNRAGTTGWKKAGRTVRKGERAFSVWTPIRRRPTEQETRQREAAGHKVAREPDGRPAVQVVGFGLSPTFDLSQTDGEPFEPPTLARVGRQRVPGGVLPRLLTGEDPTGAYDDVVDLITKEGYHFGLAAPGSPDLGAANGRTVNGPVVRTVRVRDDVDGAQRIKTTLHELAHIRCGHLDDTHAGEDLHHGRTETEAESVAHIVCKALGLDTQAYSDAYVVTWAGGDMTLVRDCAETVLRVAKQILDDLTPVADTGTTG